MILQLPIIRTKGLAEDKEIVLLLDREMFMVMATEEIKEKAEVKVKVKDKGMATDNQKEELIIVNCRLEEIFKMAALSN